MLNLYPILKVGVVGGLGVLASSNILESKMKEYDSEILEPIDKVSIIIPSFNEEQFIGTTLSSIKNQSIIQQYPEYFELILIDSGSKDDTIKLATPYVDKIITTTARGKLTARNLAANEAKGNIVVAVDADTYYPYHWLNSLLVPFNDYMNPKYENIVGVFGSTFDYTINHIPGKLFTVGDFIYNSYLNRSRMVGRNSSYWKHAFYLADRFDEEINQLSIWPMFNEEEKMFGQRLSKIGKIVYKINASCYHLGGAKSIGRLIGNNEIRNKYKFGEERF